MHVRTSLCVLMLAWLTLLAAPAHAGSKLEFTVDPGPLGVVGVPGPSEGDELNFGPFDVFGFTLERIEFYFADDKHLEIAPAASNPGDPLIHYLSVRAEDFGLNAANVAFQTLASLGFLDMDGNEILRADDPDGFDQIGILGNFFFASFDQPVLAHGVFIEFNPPVGPVLGAGFGNPLQSTVALNIFGDITVGEWTDEPVVIPTPTAIGGGAAMLLLLGACRAFRRTGRPD